MPLPISGDVAHDAVDARSPVKMGMKGSNAVPAEVSADGDRVDAWGDRRGRLVVSQYIAPTIRNADVVGPKTVTITAATNAAVLAAPGASLSLNVTSIKASNGSATLTRLEIVEGGADAGTDGTIVDSSWLAANGGGYVTKFDPPYKLPANTALKARLSTGVTDVRVDLMYFTA